MISAGWPGRCGGRRGAAALALLLAACAPGTAAGQLVLRDPVPRTISYERLKEGRQRVVVCNDGARVMRRVRVKFQHFGLRQEGALLHARDALQATHVPEQVARGRCASLRIALRPHVTLAQRAYAGTLVISSSAGMRRLPLTLVGSDPNGAVPVIPAAGRSATISLRIEHDAFGGGGDTVVSAGTLPVRVTEPGRRPAIPPPGASIGLLTLGTRHVVISVAPGERPTQEKDDSDVWLVPVQASGGEDTGVYRGTVNLAAAGGAAVDVPVELTVSDPVIWPLLVVVVGALVAFAAQLWLGNWRMRFRLWSRRRRIPDRYRDAAVVYGTPPAHSDVMPPDDTEVRGYVKDVKRETANVFWWFAFVDTRSDGFQGLLRSLRGAERDAACIGTEAAGSHLKRRLEDLRKETELLLSEVRANIGGARPPGPAKHAVALLRGDGLRVGSALELTKAIDAHIDYMRRWRELVEEALRWESWWLSLTAVSVKPPKKGGMSCGQRRRLLHLGTQLRQAEYGLFEAEDAAALTACRAESGLRRVGDRLTFLRTHHLLAGASDPPPAQPPKKLLKTAGAAYAWPDLGGGADDDGGLSLAAVTASVDAGAEVEPARSVDVISGVRVLVDLFVVGFSIVVGVLFVLGQQYFGKVFGSTEDYLGAFVAGALSQLLVSGLVKTLGEMRANDGDPIVHAPEPAKVNLPA